MGEAAEEGLHVVQSVKDLRVASGGPSRSVTALCDGLARAGASVDLVSSRTPPPEATVQPESPGVHLRLVTDSPRRGLWRGAGSPFGMAVAERARASGPVVLHDHGLWLPANRSVALVARATRRPLVVSPKGMLSARALRVRKAKKSLAWVLYQRRALGLTAAFQATSETEAEDIRRAGLRQPIAVIPHGVHVPHGAGTAGWRSDDRSAERRTALFLSRVHPIKGLPDLVEAWHRVRPEGWRLLIAGPDEGGHRAEVERLVGALDLQREVSFVGPVSDDEKWDLYRGADLFVLPTHSENFGIVVAEALGVGLPVLTTRGAPWRALETHR